MYIEHLDLEEYDSLHSTQNFAKEKIDLKPFTVISADIQTNGHGRYNREWLNSPGDIAITIVLPIPQTNPEQLSYVTGLAIHRTLTAFGIHSQLKWVNDVLVNQKKISGMILEKHKSFLLIGIGLNINHSKLDTATSIADICNATKTEVLTILIEQFKICFNSWQQNGFSSIRNEWLTNAYLLEQKIKVNFLDKTETGIFESIDSEGKLLLKTLDGTKTISAGEIYFSE